MPLHGSLAKSIQGGTVQQHYEELIFEVSSTASQSFSGDVGTGVNVVHTGTLECNYCDDRFNILEGFTLEVGAREDTNETWVNFTAPLLEINHSVAVGAYQATITATLVFEELIPYARAFGDIYLRWTSLKLYIDAVLDTDFGPESAYLLSVFAAPIFVPLFGIQPKLSSSCGAAVTGLPGPLPDTYTYSGSCTATATGGWRIKKHGSYSNGVVTLPTIGAPAGTGCPFGLSLPSPVATSTWGAEASSYDLQSQSRTLTEEESTTVHVIYTCTPFDESGTYILEAYDEACSATRDVYLTEAIIESYACAVRLVPDDERTLVRMGQPGHAQMLYRWGMPQTTRWGYRHCDVDGVISNASEETEVHSSQTSILSVIGDSVHACEDTLGYQAYAPVESSHTKTRTRIYSDENYVDPCACPPSAHVPPACDGLIGLNCGRTWPDHEDEDANEEVQYQFPYSVENLGDNAYLLPSLMHDEPLARYIDTWCAPWWSYGNFFPENTIDTDGDDEVDAQNEWPVLGEPIDIGYWLELGDQYTKNSALPPTEGRETRLTIFSDLLSRTGWQLYCIDNRAGFPFVGISRWLTQVATVLSEYTYDSGDSALFAGEDCSLAFGAQITVNCDGAGAQTCKFRVNLGDWATAPYQYPHLARDIEQSWVATNVSAVRILLEGVDGETVQIGTVSGTVYPKLSGTAVKYAGDWELDHGFPRFADAGFDEDPATGISAITVGDPERLLAFQLLPGVTAKYLLIEIDVADAAVNVVFDYPRLLIGDAVLHTYPLGRNAQALEFEGGPGLRFPSSTFWSEGFQNPPIPQGRQAASSIIDMLCWKRVLIEGLDAEDGLDTELSDIFDSYEGQARGQVESSDSLGFMLPFTTGNEGYRFAIVNGRAEIPPVPCFPRGVRDPDDWSEDFGTWFFGVHSWALEKRTVNTAQVQNDQFDPSDTQWTAPDETIPGWIQTSHKHAVTNEEDIDHQIREAVVDTPNIYGNLRPWHHVFDVVNTGAADAAEGNVWHDVSSSNRHARGFQRGGNMQIERSYNKLPLVWVLEADVIAGVVWTCGRWDRNSKEQLLLVIGETAGGDIKVWESTDEGSTFTLMLTLGTGSKPAQIVGRNRTRYYYWIDGTAIKGVIYDAGGNVLESTFTAVASGVDDAGIAVDERVVNDGTNQARHQILLTYISSGTVTTLVSDDGKTFS